MLLTSGRALHPPARPVQPAFSARAFVHLHSRQQYSVAASGAPLQDSTPRPESHSPIQHLVARHQLGSKLALTLAATLSSPLCASAAEIDYAPGQGADVVKNVGGLVYVGLLAFWLFKVVGRRIKKSTTERLASQQEKEVEEVDVADAPVSVGSAFLGAVQASFFTYLLFLFSNSVSGYFSQQGLPDNYTARNMSVTFRTAIAGLAYLATFIFGANAAGLTGLTLKLLISPDDPASAKDAGKQRQDES